jgi:ABC-type taurine transport system ATPase subunit
MAAMMQRPMTVIQLTEENGGIDSLLAVFAAIVKYSEGSTMLDVRIGINPVDSGITFSVNGLPWSPPIAGEIS